MSKERVEAFSDGVFAIAITLLILTIAVPVVGHGKLARALFDQWPQYATYAVSFVTIGIIWVNHHATFSRIARVDRPLLFINLFLLMAVSFIPFPTSLLAHYLQSGSDARVAAFLYAVTMTVMSIFFAAIYLWAIHRHLLKGDDRYVLRVRSALPRFALGTLGYGVCIALALISPPLSLALFAAIAVYYMFEQQAEPMDESETERELADQTNQP